MWEKILHPFVLAVAWVWAKIHDFLVLIGMSSGSGIAWVLSIVLLTILVRLLITPLYMKQIKSMRGTQAMQPELQRIQQKYKGKKDTVSRQKMAEESQALYKKYGTNPLASCLPMLVQMPVFLALYRAIFAVKPLMDNSYTIGGEPKQSLGPITSSVAREIDQSTVLGVQLSHTISSAGNGTMGVVAFIVGIVMMVLVMFVQMRWSMTKNMPPAADPNNPMVRSQKGMMYLMPLMYIFTGIYFQMGLMVYMMTTTIWSALQMLWVIKVLPTPGSPAYAELLGKRSSAYQDWARPYFESYDQRRADLADDQVDAFNEKTLAEVQTQAKKQHVNSKFPESMSTSDKVSIYRNLAMQEWTTLPDEQWMMGVKRATERVKDRQRQSQLREQPRRLTKAQRREEAERAQQAAQDEAAAERKRARREQQNRKAASRLTQEEIDRRRQARQVAKRNAKKNK